MLSDWQSKVIWAIIGLIVLNPIWEYLIKPTIEKLRSKYSQTVKRENTELQERINVEVERLLTDPSEREYFHFETLEVRQRYQHQGQTWMFSVILFLVILSQIAVKAPKDMTTSDQIGMWAYTVISMGGLGTLYWRYLRLEHRVDFHNKVNKLVREKIDEDHKEKILQENKEAIFEQLKEAIGRGKQPPSG